MKDRGFTLIELMVVIVIIGIMLIIASPSIRNWYTGFQLKSSADNIMNTLAAARLTAINTNSNQIVVFNLSNNSYYVINDANRDCTNLNDVTSGSCVQPGDLGPTYTLPPTIQFGYVQVANPVPQAYSAIFPTATTTACALFCKGNIGAVEFNASGKAINMFSPDPASSNGIGGAIVLIPDSDLINNNSSRQIIIGFVSMTGAVVKFGE